MFKIWKGACIAALAWMAPVCYGWWWCADGDLDRLTAIGLRSNPTVRTKWLEFQAAEHGRAELRGFWDPQLTAEAAGTVETDGEESARLGMGVGMPLARAGYWDVSLEQGYAWPALESGFNSLYQTTARLDWRLPLLRDRTFRLWYLRDERAAVDQQAAYGRWMAAAQDLRRDITLAYIAVLERQALLQVSESALERADRLLAEAQALAELDTIPAYQVAAARLESALRSEELIAMHNALESNRLRLREMIGLTPSDSFDLPPGNGRLMQDARSAPCIEDALPPMDLMRRGDTREAVALERVEELSKRMALERRRSDLSFGASLVHRGEHPDSWPATEAVRTSRAGAWELSLKWSRPLGRKAETAEAERRRELLDASGELVRKIETASLVRLRDAENLYRAAARRLHLVEAAVNAAASALQAEEERFRLGEGRSRIVLDAQKDLTDTLRREISVAAELLRAATFLHYSLGFAPLERVLPETE